MPYFTNRGITPLVAPGAGLLTSLYAYWEFEEIGTNQNDRQDSSTNNKDLTVNSNNCTNVTGIGGLNVATYSSAGSGYARADEAALDFTGEWSASFWIKFDTVPSGFAPVVLDKRSSPVELNVVYNGFSNRIQLTNAATDVIAEGSFTPSNGVWFHTVCGVRSGDVFIAVNGGTTATTPVTLAPTNGAGAFAFFPDALPAVAIDQAGLWIGRGLSDGEIDLLYNSGAGLRYTEL